MIAECIVQFDTLAFCGYEKEMIRLRRMHDPVAYVERVLRSK
jgi:hypothetical protein